MQRSPGAAALAAAAGALVLALASAGPARPAGPACDPANKALEKATGLTGTWTGNDGATYWIRQIGSCLWWTGFSGPVDTATMGKSFSNVFFGTVTSTTSATGSWADVPRGATLGSGTLTLGLKLSTTSKQIYKRIQGGSPFGASLWTLNARTFVIPKTAVVTTTR